MYEYLRTAGVKRDQINTLVLRLFLSTVLYESSVRVCMFCSHEKKRFLSYCLKAVGIRF